jgi:hypothetical protein
LTGSGSEFLNRPDPDPVPGPDPDPDPVPDPDPSPNKFSANFFLKFFVDENML